MKSQREKLFKETMKLWDEDYKYVIATPEEIIGAKTDEERDSITKNLIEYKVFSFEAFQLYATDLIV